MWRISEKKQNGNYKFQTLYVSNFFSKYLLFTILSVIFTESFAQNGEKKETKSNKLEVSLEGMLAASVGKEFYSFNVGGPALGLKLNENLKIGVAAYPSFYVKSGKTGAKLGVGPRIDYKNLVLISPFFSFESQDEWVWTIGLGYKFHAKK
jgi:hypothetical protein